MTYETNDKGKIGSIHIVMDKDSLGYHVVYTWDRMIDAVLDSVNFGTLRTEKVIGDKHEMRITRGTTFMVYFKGRYTTYREDRPIYDRHTLDFSLRGFDYVDGFKKTIRLHIPEFMVVNADVAVVDKDTVTCPLGALMCWKVELSPRIIFTRRKFYFWIEQEYPYRFVKFEDTSGSNSVVLIEYHQ